MTILKNDDLNVAEKKLLKTTYFLIILFEFFCRP